MPACRYVEEMGSAGVTPEVNLWESVSCMPPPSVNKAAHSGFKTQIRHHPKSSTRVSVAPQKDLRPPKIFLKKTFMPCKSLLIKFCFTFVEAVLICVLMLLDVTKVTLLLF